MEIYEHSLLEELLALRRDNTWETSPLEMSNEFLSNYTWSSSSFEFFDNQNPPPCLPNLSNYNHNSNTSSEMYYPIGFDTPPFHVPEDNINPWPMIGEEEELSLLGDERPNLESTQDAVCKVEQIQSSSSPEEAAHVFNMGICVERNNRASKKMQGQPSSKNLMAERRRRKRLNDRLSMLRSIVPKISKMDRTSILGDTIDYMKELLDRINNLQHEIEEGGSETSDQLDLMRQHKDKEPSEMLLRNSPKFDVQRRKVDTRIGIYCAGKPGLLLSTVSTLDALGLEIQQCVISCFSDFAMQASCSENLDQRTLVSSEDMKQALFKNAGYGGRCL